MKIGILGLQGGIYEHIYLLRKAFKLGNIEGRIIIVKDSEALSNIDGLIIPGGESTTLGALLNRLGMVDSLREYIINGHPTMGVCAGAILLAKEAVDQNIGNIEQPLLGVMNIRAIRNYFGRQRNSFETLIEISGLDGPPYRAIFIRAPVFEALNTDVDKLAYVEGKLVMAREDNVIVTSFHPELTDDPRIHLLFLSLIKRELIV